MQITTQVVGHEAQLTCYIQEPSSEMAPASVRPAVLILPGGGYFFTSDREAEPVALAYLAEGFNAFVLRYAVGSGSPFEASFDDAKGALAWIREHSRELHVDPRKVAAVGFSAGGHLAASLGTAADDKPDALILGYPVTLPEMSRHLGKDLLDVPSHVSVDTPPTFLFSTCDDLVVPIRHSIALLDALAQHGVPFESHIYLLGPHGMSLAKKATSSGGAAEVDAAVAQWLPDSVRFLWSVFGHFQVVGEAETYELLRRRRQLGLEMPVGRLLESERGAAVLLQHAPGVVAAAERDALVGLANLSQLTTARPDLLSLEALARVEAALNG